MKKQTLLLALAVLFGLPVPLPIYVYAADKDAVVNAIIGVDPRARRTTGLGAALDSAYGPKETNAETEEELPQEEDFSKTGLRYNDEFNDLRSPLLSPEPEEDKEMEPRDNPNSTDVSVVPLGKPEEREGVKYEDDLIR